MLFDVSAFHREVYTVTTIPTAEHIFLSVQDKVKQNLKSAQRELTFLHHWYSHEKYEVVPVPDKWLEVQEKIWWSEITPCDTYQKSMGVLLWTPFMRSVSVG